MYFRSRCYTSKSTTTSINITCGGSTEDYLRDTLEQWMADDQGEKNNIFTNPAARSVQVFDEMSCNAMDGCLNKVA